MERADSAGDSRRQALVTAITAELERQAQTGAARIDVEALAEAIETSIDPGPPAAEGKRPSELNATNDD